MTDVESFAKDHLGHMATGVTCYGRVLDFSVIIVGTLKGKKNSNREWILVEYVSAPFAEGLSFDLLMKEFLPFSFGKDLDTTKHYNGFSVGAFSRATFTPPDFKPDLPVIRLSNKPPLADWNW